MKPDSDAIHEEACYIYHERLGIGLDLGMPFKEAQAIAVHEARVYEVGEVMEAEVKEQREGD